ncbi:MAG: hypothetical protein WDZ52_10685 [Pseudohongiellaceae bacterium]
MRSIKILAVLCCLVLLIRCQAPAPSASGETAASAGNVSSGETIAVRVLSDAEVYSGSGSAGNRSAIPDILYEALQALNADRLLTPLDDNAHARFKRVLAMDPQNQIALEGLQDIVKRYLQLSRESMRRGQFEETEIMLDRARFVDASHPEIAAVADALQQERNSDDLFFVLDYPQYAARSETAQQELADIANQARKHEAFFLITAPNDALGRWMVSIMRETVSGYRLRGNIELSNRLGIRLRLPSD